MSQTFASPLSFTPNGDFIRKPGFNENLPTFSSSEQDNPPNGPALCAKVIRVRPDRLPFPLHVTFILYLP